MAGDKALRDRSFGSIVTGSAGTLGAAVMRALTKRGDRVIGLDRLVPETSSATSLPVELTDAASVRAAVDQAAEMLGQIDVLVHAAGIMRVSSFMQTTEGDLEKQLDVNLMGAFRVCQAVAARMLGTGGRILIMTSVHGQVGVPGRAAYAASKGALAALGRVMAAELAPHRIRVNMLAPGAVDGGLQPTASSRDHWVAATPSQRVAQPDEVARFAAMLTSDDASFINGQTIAIDGGASTLKAFSPSAEA